MIGKGITDLDYFLLNNENISEDEREEIIKFVLTLGKDLE